MFRIRTVALALLSSLSLMACGSDTPDVKPLDPATWCDNLEAGPSGTGDLALDLSAAHAGVRFFGAELDGGSADVALADALDAPNALSSSGIGAALAAYKAPLVNVCVLPANDAPIPAARVEMQGAVAVIHPGTGDVTVPGNAAAVAIDLRDLPNRPELEPVLEAVTANVLTAEDLRSQLLVVVNSGLPAELTDYTGIYFKNFGSLLPAPLPGTASHALPLAVITGPRMAPLAAELAVDLRLSNKAWLIGSDVRAAAAESCWAGVGSEGIAYRCRELSSGTTRWADAIPADYPLSQLDAKLKELPSLGVPQPISNGLPNDRPFLAALDPLSRPEPATLRLGDARAALLTVQGAARLFSPAVLDGGEALDLGLTPALEALGAAPDRAGTLNALRGLDAALDDGQAFAEDTQDTGTDKLPLVLEQVGAEPVVRASGDANVHPGDRIAAIDGTPFDTWYQARKPLLSAATEAFRLQRALDLLVRQSSAVLSLVDPAGTARDVTVAAQPDAVFQATRKGALRASGILPGTNVYYLDADGLRLDTADTLATLTQAAMSADGLILDLRGNPTVSPYDLAKVLVTHNFSSPLFRIPLWQGQEGLSFTDLQQSYSPNRQVFDKKVVLLVGPSTVGPAEITASTIRDAVEADLPLRVKTVGRQTTGTSGTVSVLRLPGGFTFGFTGMQTLHADGTAVASPGIVPDVESEPTQQDLADGIDTELNAALNTLSAM